MRSLLLGLFEKQIGHILWFLGLLTLLMLTRTQFIFMYVVALCALGYLLFIQRLPHRKIGIGILALVISFCSANLLERSYHYIFNNQFQTVPFTGIQLIISPLYLAISGDEEIFKDPLEKAVFLNVRKIIKDNKWDAESTFQNQHPPYQHFLINYNHCVEALMISLSNNRLQDYGMIDKTLVNMSLKLIVKNWQRWLRLYSGNIINNIGGYYFFLLLMIAFITSFFVHLRQKDFFSLGLFFVILTSFGNYTLVALVETAMATYNFYTNTVLLSFLIILVVGSLQKLHINRV